MKITMNIPDDIAQRIQEKHPDLARHVLECVALECYRSRILSEEQVRRWLGFESRFEVHTLLKQRGVPLNYTLEDLEADRETHRRLGLSS
jgi:predicted HTH domain antitoxin